jgi:hypothetical protein
LFTCGIDNGVIFDEKGGDVKMSIAAGVVEGDEPTLVLGVYVRPLLQQVLGHLKHTQPSTEHLQNLLLTI